MVKDLRLMAAPYQSVCYNCYAIIINLNYDIVYVKQSLHISSQSVKGEFMAAAQ